MLELYKDSLRLTATYGMVIAASVILFGAFIGRWIDRAERITAARTFLVIQNTAVSLCAMLLAGYISYRDELDPEKEQMFTYFVSIGGIVLASVARLGSTGTNIIIQKDWVVVIAGEDTDYLAKVNSILRTIELVTYMIAPAIAGQLFTFLGFGWTGIFIAVWNLVSVCVEYLLLAKIYKTYPALSKKGTEASNDDEESQEEPSPNFIDGFKDALGGWKIYMNHPVRFAGLGLSCLFMTVLGFDNITYGYCLMQKVPHAALGALVGVSALVGVAGSLAYPIFRRKFGLERTGLLGMFLLISCSSFAVLSVFLPGSPLNLSHLSLQETEAIIENLNNTEIVDLKVVAEKSWIDPDFWLPFSSVLVLLSGIILARFGLWVVDLTVSQIIQEMVEEDVRGVINGVQDSMNNALDLTKCVLVILLPAQETFGLLIIASFVSINIGWLLYALYCRSQGHLSCLCKKSTEIQSNSSDA